MWSQWRFRIWEGLIVLSFVAVLIALIVPGTQWASSGSIQTFVHVHVIDAASGRPIPQASVAFLPSTGGRVSRTASDGLAVSVQRFRTSGSHKHPPRAHVGGRWVQVAADGYRTVVVPLGDEAVETRFLKENVLVVKVALQRVP